MAVGIVDQLIERRLADVLLPRFDHREFRLSETGTCARKRVLRVLGYEPIPFDEQSARYFERGNIAEAWVVRQFRAAYPRRTRTQVKVRTPYGDTGHIDLWFPAERRIIEVKSVSRASFDTDIPRDVHLKQVQAYLNFFCDADGQPRADEGELVYVDMDTLRTHTFPVRRDPVQGAEIAAELQRLHDMAQRGELPPVEFFPDQAPCVTHTPFGTSKCEFWHHCHNADTLDFGLPVDRLDAIADLAADYLAAKSVYEPVRRQADELKKAVDAAKEQLLKAMADYGRDEAVAGDYVVKVTHVQGQVRWDIDAAKKAGVIPAEVLQALVAYSKKDRDSDRVSVKLNVSTTPKEGETR